jgi:hypothetical protein
MFDKFSLKTPEVSQELLEYLDRFFPLTSFKNVQSEKELYKLQGSFEVIDHLRSLHGNPEDNLNVFRNED